MKHASLVLAFATSLSWSLATAACHKHVVVGPMNEPSSNDAYEAQPEDPPLALPCCVNHLQYTCASSDELTSCTSMQAHRCTPAGGC